MHQPELNNFQRAVQAFDIGRMNTKSRDKIFAMPAHTAPGLRVKVWAVKLCGMDSEESLGRALASIAALPALALR